MALTGQWGDEVSLLRKLQIFSSNIAKLWEISDANTARTTSTVVGAVQQVDQTGKVPPAGDTLSNAPFSKATNYDSAGDELFTAGNRGNVDVVGALPAGTNKIGKVQIEDSSGNELFTEGNLGKVAIGDGTNPNLDAFGRLRVSDPITLFESSLQYNKGDLLWEENLTGGASGTHLPNESAVQMRCGTASGDKVIRQTYRYFRYQAGKSQLIEMTGVMGAKKANVRQRIGYFDAQNGLFFEQDENNLKIVRRTYTSGSAVDNAVNQSSWNIDIMDGNGPSQVTLDMSKTQIFVIDFQWLGAGRVRFGFVVDGDLYYVHELLNANNLTEVYMTTGNLPLRYEIENTAGTASDTDMIHICSSVMSEGGFEDQLGITHSASNGVTRIGVTTRRPVLSIRPKTTFNSITNRAEILPLKVDCYADAPIYYEVVLNGTLTGASFNSAGTNALCDFDIASTAISNGEIIDSGFVGSAKQGTNQIVNAIKNKLTLSNDLAGTTTDILSVVVTSFSGTANTSAEITWKEIY